MTDQTPDAADEVSVVREVTHREPTGGTPPAVDNGADLATAVARLAHGSGPIAIDAERASGYRYSQRAYLVQFAREGSGIVLVDPTMTDGIGTLVDLVNGLPWVLHAATQDLPCLREAGFRPTEVFDTELAARLLGRPRVGLAALLEEELGIVLAKEHSAVDWSQRPLPADWLAYAALDVEFLGVLHTRLLDALTDADRLTWYDEERALLTDFTGPAPREEPWRRVSGIHVLRDPRRLAIVRALWEARDERARDLDVSPGRVLHDSVIVDLARHAPATMPAMLALRPVHSRNARKDPEHWWHAIERARALTDAELPRRTQAEGTLPPPRSWAQRNPEAAARWEVVRPAVVATAESLGIAAEVLVSPDIVRQFCWFGCEASPEGITADLRDRGARRWQTQALAPPFAVALRTLA